MSDHTTFRTVTSDSDLVLRHLTRADVPQLQSLLEADAGYALRVIGSPPTPDAAADLLISRPPGLNREAKVLLGAEDPAGLAAVVDVLRGWPNPTTAHIGLLQVHANRHREGIGQRTHQLLLDVIAHWPEITSLRAAIVGTNAAHAEPFWSALGYRPGGPATPYAAGTVTTDVTIWHLDLLAH